MKVVVIYDLGKGARARVGIRLIGVPCGIVLYHLEMENKVWEKTKLRSFQYHFSLLYCRLMLTVKHNLSFTRP